MITTGMVRSAGSPFMRRSTSMPSTLGIFRSSSTSFGFCASGTARHSSASAPSFAHRTRLTRLFCRSARIVISASCGLSSTSRISICSTIGAPRQGEMEAGALAGTALGPDAAAVAGHDALHDGEPDAGARELVGAVQPLEYAEELSDVAHVEADAVVAHPVDAFRRLLAPADLDVRSRALAAVLERVADEVRPHLPQQPGVRVACGQRADVDGGIAARQLLRHLAREAGHVDRALAEGEPPEARKIEQVVDELPHVPAARAHHAEQAPALRVEARAVVLFEDLGEAVDRPQRRAQVVRDRVAE